MVKTKEFVFDWFDNENVYGYEINGPNTFTILLDKTNEIPKAGLTSSGKVATDIQFKNHTIALIIEKRRKWEQYTENEIQKPKIEKPEIEKPKITCKLFSFFFFTKYFFQIFFFSFRFE